MYRNFVNRDDVPRLIEKLRQGYAARLAGLLSSGPADRRVKRAWAHTQSPPKRWGSVPAVKRRWNHRITGNEDAPVYAYVVEKHLQNRCELIGFSLGCGTGSHEIAFAKTGRFRSIRAVDISPERIAAAKRRAAALGLSDVLSFQEDDARTLPPAPRPYDVVIAFGALHHITPLEPVLASIPGLLADDGIFVLWDFVGPARFQWTDRQIEVVDGLLGVLPRRLRTRWKSGTLKKRFYRQSRLSMLLTDPSEAAESEMILPWIDRYLEPIEEVELGGTVLHLLLDDIAHHFSTQDEEAAAWLQTLFEIEDLLIRTGELTSDFRFGVYKKPAPKS